jgi:hypothetical protein
MYLGFRAVRERLIASGASEATEDRLSHRHRTAWPFGQAIDPAQLGSAVGDERPRYVARGVVPGVRGCVWVELPPGSVEEASEAGSGVASCGAGLAGAAVSDVLGMARRAVLYAFGS